MLHTALMIIQFICAVSITALVLLQRGRGAEAGAGFGSGASGTVFGARGARTALSRATAVLAAVFMVNSLLLTYLGTQSTAAAPSVLDKLSSQTIVPAATVLPATVPATAPAASAPGNAPGGTGGGSSNR
jgi:preprotein translocase subunit SecG